MNDGNESKIDGMINFDKLRMMANRVKDISKLVDYEYENINVDSELQNYISHPMVEGDALLMEKSLKLEPRDAKK